MIKFIQEEELFLAFQKLFLFSSQLKLKQH
jgi:hypothetical protein